MSIPLSSTRVLVTGASGFVGLHIVRHLLQQGYIVRGTVRTEAKAARVREILSSHADTTRLEFACADLVDDRGWPEAVQGCDYVIHTAAPYLVENVGTEDDLVIPARDGTLRVLRAAQAGGARRVVLLSTIGAIFDGHEGENRIFDERDWTDLEKCRLAYHKAKTLAELAAWEFIRGPENQSNMELVAINPSSVFGPVLDDHPHTSILWFRSILHHEVPGVSRSQLNFVDVRDLVELLGKAMIVPEAAGKRFICNTASMPLLEFANILQQNYSARGYRIYNRVLPDAAIRLVAVFMEKARPIARQLGWTYTLSTEQASTVFGWQPRPYRETVLDMADSLIEHGLV